MAEKKSDKDKKGDPEGTDAVVVDANGKRVMPKALDLKVDLDRLELDEVSVEVENLSASLDLKVSVANFVNVQASASAHLGKTSVEVKGLGAEAHLGVDINNVTRVVETTLKALTENPEILKVLEKTVESSVGALGIGVNESLTSLLGDDNDPDRANKLLDAIAAVTPGGSEKSAKKK